MPVEVTDKYIKVRVNDPDKYAEFRIGDFSTQDHIKCVIGIFEQDGTQMTEIQALLFEKEYWSVDDSIKWAQEQGCSIKSARPTVKFFDIIDIKGANYEGVYSFEGYASIKGNTDSHGEIVSSIVESVYNLERYKKNPILYCDHEYNVKNIIGHIVEIKEDEKGLYFKAELMIEPQSEEAKQAIALIKQGILRGVSIGGIWHYDAKDLSTIVRADIFEISIVGIPSNPETMIGTIVKSEDALSKKVVEMDDQDTKAILGVKIEVDGETVLEQEIDTDATKPTSPMPDEQLPGEEQKQEQSNDLPKSEEALQTKGAMTMDEKDVKALIDAEMKKVNINLTTEKKDTKAESRKALESLFAAGLKRDYSSCQAISKEIEDNNYAQKAIQRSDSASVGGYAIPVEVMEDIIKLSYAKAKMLNAARLISVTGESMTIPTMGNVVAVDIDDQGTALTESNSTFTGPSINMKRVGLFTDVSNTLISQKQGIIEQFIQLYSSAFARYLDYRLVCGNITFDGHSQDGLCFQANATKNPVINLSDLSFDNFKAMSEQISDEAESLLWVGNRQIYNSVAYSKVSASGDTYAFPGAISGLGVTPQGIEFIQNNKITNVLNVSGDKATTGNESALILMDKTKLLLAVSDMMRIEMSPHFKFTSDVTTIRGIARVGWVLPLAGMVIVQPVNMSA